MSNLYWLTDAQMERLKSMGLEPNWIGTKP